MRNAEKVDIVSYMAMRDLTSCKPCPKALRVGEITNLLRDFLSSLPHHSLRISLYSLGGLTSLIYVYSAVDLSFPFYVIVFLY